MPANDGTSLTVELFVADAAAARDFYVGVLGFTVVREEANGWVALERGAARIALLPRKVEAGAPRTFELTLSVDDVEAQAAAVAASGWPLHSPLKRRPWGQQDFRIVDPDGHGVRVTSP